MAGYQVTTGLVGNPRELKDWLVSVGKGCPRRKLFIWHLNAAKVSVSMFIGHHQTMHSHLTGTELEGLLIGEYADEGTVMEAMRPCGMLRLLMKLPQMSLPES